MNYGVIKLREDGLTTYNLDIFKNGEDVIILPLEEFNTEILRLKYYLEKSGDKAENIIKGRIRHKKQEIGKIGDELSSAEHTINSLTCFTLQTSLTDFDWPEFKVKKRKRISNSRSGIQALVGMSEA